MRINEANEHFPSPQKALYALYSVIAHHGWSVGGPLVQLYETAAQEAGATPEQIQAAILKAKDDRPT